LARHSWEIGAVRNRIQVRAGITVAPRMPRRALKKSPRGTAGISSVRKPTEWKG